MAMQLLHLRRTLTSLSSLNRTCSTPNPTVLSITAPIFNASLANSTQSPRSFSPSSFAAVQSRLFRSSASLLSSSTKQYKLYKEGDEIGPDTVLFEGCNFNHWLITVDFPKDNKPPPDAMVRTYEEICAKGLGISIEEAKKRIYACSTTTYEGFQAIMTEEESEKFKDIPGVVFVLPDSYIDPVNKEYGGDKYENGVITHRPPPVQYGRNRGRPRDQNRNYDRPRYEQQGNTTQNWRGSSPHNQQGSMRGDGVYGANHGPPQSQPPQQNFGAQLPMNRDHAPGGRDSYQADRSGLPPSYQGNYSQTGQRNYTPQDQRQFKQWDQRNHAPPGQSYWQGANPGFGHSYQNHEQGVSHGYGQRSSIGANPGSRQGSAGHGDGQRFSQAEQSVPVGPPGTTKGSH